MQKDQGLSKRRKQKIRPVPLVCLTITGILLLMSLVRGELNSHENKKVPLASEDASPITRATAMLATRFSRQKLQEEKKETLSVDDPRPLARNHGARSQI